MPARRIAEMFVEGFGDSNVLIFGDHIARRSLSSTGRVGQRDVDKKLGFYRSNDMLDSNQVQNFIQKH